jgi:1-deoxy-D-xylulose-5-phosphate reductoisomerase
MKRVVVLGSTGSIGVNTLKVIQDHPQEFQVVGLAARNNAELLAQQIRIFRPTKAAIHNPSSAKRLKDLLGVGAPEILVGEEGVEALAAMEGADFVVVAITGAAALKPTLSAISKGRAIGLANKETLVMAGELVMREAKQRGAVILPIDSEHSAIFQCLQGHSRDEVRRILLTSSGGPLRDVPKDRFGQMTKAQILDHPRWKMGPKITVDSATMMNKGLEVIEARWLFGIPVEKIEVVIHPEAIVHSMVEFIDGSILAQLGVTDMRLPIQYALTYPRRLESSVGALDLVGLKSLTFERVDPKFPCVGFGYQAARSSGTAPAVLNAANEAAVAAFLSDSLEFQRIPQMIESVLGKHRPTPNPTLAQILEADAWAHEQVESVLATPSVARGKQSP